MAGRAARPADGCVPTRRSQERRCASSPRSCGWLTAVEVSFNHYGDRGRVDVLALHAPTRAVLVVEVKSALGDLQETLGRLDIKARLGRMICRFRRLAGRARWLPALIIGDSRTRAARVAGHAALFARFSVRGRSARRGCDIPRLPSPTGSLWFVSVPDSHGVARYARVVACRIGQSEPLTRARRCEFGRFADRCERP